jgi:hypothetical protein
MFRRLNNKCLLKINKYNIRKKCEENNEKNDYVKVKKQ